MTDSLEKSVEQISTLAGQLNTATDAANETVAAVDAFLKDRSVGIPAFVKVSDRDVAGGCCETTYLGYDRLQGIFRIGVTVETWGPEDGEDDRSECSRLVSSETRGWSGCDRKTKLDAFKKLPDLMRAIARDASHMVNETTQTVEVVRAMMGAISTNKPATAAVA